MTFEISTPTNVTDYTINFVVIAASTRNTAAVPCMVIAIPHWHGPAQSLLRDDALTRNTTHQEALKLRIPKGRFQPHAFRYPCPLVPAHLPLLLLPVFSSSPPLVPALADTRRSCRLNNAIPRAFRSCPLFWALSAAAVFGGCFSCLRARALAGAGRIGLVTASPTLVRLVADQRAVRRATPGTAVLGSVLSTHAACF